jgi:hypothetical protein
VLSLALVVVELDEWALVTDRLEVQGSYEMVIGVPGDWSDWRKRYTVR